MQDKMYFCSLPIEIHDPTRPTKRGKIYTRPNPTVRLTHHLTHEQPCLDIPHSRRLEHTTQADCASTLSDCHQSLPIGCQLSIYTTNM